MAIELTSILSFREYVTVFCSPGEFKQGHAVEANFVLRAFGRKHGGWRVRAILRSILLLDEELRTVSCSLHYQNDNPTDFFRRRQKSMLLRRGRLAGTSALILLKQCRESASSISPRRSLPARNIETECIAAIRQLRPVDHRHRPVLTARHVFAGTSGTTRL